MLFFPEAACPFVSPYAHNNGFSCCSFLKKLDNQTVDPLCNGGTLLLTDPAECCAGRQIACVNNYTGCYTSPYTQFNGEILFITGHGKGVDVVHPYVVCGQHLLLGWTT